MIPFVDIENRMKAFLDAEGSDYYDTDRDIIPAVNAAQEWILSVLQLAAEQKKFDLEVLRDLVRVDVFNSTVDSRVSFDVFPVEPWTILAVYANPVTGSTGAAGPTQIQLDADKNTLYRDDLYHKTSEDSADRKSLEEWATNKDNPLVAGYDGSIWCSSLTLFSYLNPINYNPDSVVTINRELEIRPNLNRGLVSIFYVSTTTKITSAADNVEFPVSAKNLLVERALKYIAFKQGDGTTLASITTDDITTVLRAML